MNDFKKEIKMYQQCNALVKNCKRDLREAILNGETCSNYNENHYSEEVNECAANYLSSDLKKIKITYEKCDFGRMDDYPIGSNCFLMNICFDQDLKD